MVSLPVVLIHPFPLSDEAFAEDTVELSSVAEILTPSMRGFGGAAPFDEETPPSIDAMADDVARLLDERGIDHAVVGGLSMGGYVSLAFARRHSRRLRGLILANTRAEPDSPEARLNRETAIARIAAGDVAGFVDGMLGKLLGPRTRKERPEVVDHVRRIAMTAPPSAFIDALRALRDRPDARPALSAIGVPTLVIAGRDDEITPVAAAETIHATIAGSSLVVLPDAGHLSNVDAPAAFRAAVREFLERL